MIAVSEAFKTAMKASGVEGRKAYLTDGTTTINESNDLQSLKLIISGDIGRAVMRQAEAVYIGNHEYLGQYVNIGIGVTLPDTSVEYIDYGRFRIVSKEDNKGNDGIKVKMFDQMYEAEIKYDLTPTFPTTVLGFLQAICTRFDWVLATTSFPNSDLVISTDLFSNLGVTFRELLEDVAEAAGSIIMFNTDNELVVKQISDTVVETLDSDILSSLKLEEAYGPITMLSLSRDPQGDVIIRN